MSNSFSKTNVCYTVTELSACVIKQNLRASSLINHVVLRKLNL